MQISSDQSVPALLDKNFKTKVVFYPEAGVHILRDDKGIEVLDKDYRPYKPEREFINLMF